MRRSKRSQRPFVYEKIEMVEREYEKGDRPFEYDKFDMVKKVERPFEYDKFDMVKKFKIVEKFETLEKTIVNSKRLKKVHLDITPVNNEAFLAI